MSSRRVTLLCCFAVFLTAINPVISARGRRSDDPAPLEAIVNGLAQQVTQLTAQMQAQEAEIRDLKTHINADEQVVAFTARFSQSDILGLGVGQTLKFNSVLYNAGSGYDPTTGVFTAPSSGTYFFTITVMRHNADDNVSEIGLYKGNTAIANAYACCSTWNSATATATVHMNKGETTHVQMVVGTMLYGQRITTFSGMRISSN